MTGRTPRARSTGLLALVVMTLMAPGVASAQYHGPVSAKLRPASASSEAYPLPPSLVGLDLSKGFGQRLM